MPEQTARIEPLLQQARSANILRYGSMSGDAVTLQIGRVVYSMQHRRAVAFLQDALEAAGMSRNKAVPSE